jgi:uncharacterized 2Fe-2S/4Fe-4S cluster protein (DUF4445 family)
VKILLNHFSLSASGLDRVYISASSGTLRESVFAELGFVPAELGGKICFIENASVKGSRMCAVDRSLFKVAENMVREAVFIQSAPDGPTSSADFLPGY